jgi:hypothetical protein
MRALHTKALAVLLLVALAACGGGDKAPRPTSTPLPQFEEIVPPTTVPLLETAAATVQAGAAARPAIDLSRRPWPGRCR